MIYSRISRYLIFQKELFGKFRSEEESEKAHYSLQILLINLEKLLIVYFFSFLLSVMINTFIMHLTYFLLRKFAGGWHAKKSINCTLFSSLCFVFIPWLAKKYNFLFSMTAMCVLIFVVSFTVIRYAPADTEKNPLVSISERKKRRKSSILVTIFVLLASIFVKSETLKFNILSGLLLESVTIHPAFYKLTKRSYRNYEEYESIK